MANTTIDRDQVLDVTIIEPRLKHPTIFKYFDALVPGTHFIIHNDHDPKPVYYQLLGERGNIFSFEYLESGPKDWLIKIQKNAKDDATGEITTGSIVAKDMRKAEVFKSMGIDYSCNGKQTLKEASQEAGMELADLERKLAGATAPVSEPILNYHQWDLPFLADFIAHTEHVYIKETAVALNDLAQKVSQKHRDKHPELIELEMTLDQCLAALLFHVNQEKSVLFSAIKQLEGAPALDPVILQRQLRIGLSQKRQANKNLADSLKNFRALTGNYRAPADACDAYTFFFKLLADFDIRMYRYLHLENNLLFSGADKLI